MEEAGGGRVSLSGLLLRADGDETDDVLNHETTSNNSVYVTDVDSGLAGGRGGGGRG